MNRDKILVEKISFLNNAGFSIREKIYKNVKSRIFAIENLDKIPIHKPKPEPASIKVK